MSRRKTRPFALRNQPFRVPESALLPVGTRPFGKPENGEPDRRFGKCPKNPRPFLRKPSTFSPETLDPFARNPRPFCRNRSTLLPVTVYRPISLPIANAAFREAEEPEADNLARTKS